MSKSSKDVGFFPVAQPITAGDFTPDPEGPELPPGLPGGIPGRPGLPGSFPWPPWPPLRYCGLSLPQGCYQLSISTTYSKSPFFFRSFKLGSLRVEHSGSGYIISGDTYRYAFFDILWGGGIPSFGPAQIPVYPRNRYRSYLKATSVYIPRFSFGRCRITLNLDAYDYTQPLAPSFDGSFPSTPSRSMTIYLTPATPPSGYTGAYLTGQVYIGGVLQTSMSITLAWVSDHYRKATVEVHTMTGAVAPAPVPASGGGTEYFDTVYQHANWQLNVITDPTPVPVPSGVTATACWAYGNLHNVMTNLVDFPTVNLDREWYIHLLVVPAALHCGRGAMFDSINVPREGVASYSDDGYPSSESANFGTAANQLQRNVTRAFLRSASHEITHGFNQIHQELEGGADNSIMTTTPSVADYLATHGGTFPNDIFLGFNDHVRHHLIHLPDIVIRPGGMTFNAGHNGIPVPQADTDGDEMYIDHPGLDLKFAAKKLRVRIGEPLHLEWELKNVSDEAIWLPGDLSIEDEFAEISVTKPNGDEIQMPTYVIKCDSAFFIEAKPGDKISATHYLFWSTQGFAFDTPGKHTVTLEISWRSRGATVGKKASVDVFVDYPVTEKENDVIAHIMNDEVGKYVALGGHAYHLKSAVDHIEAAMRIHKDHPASKAMANFYDAKRAARLKGKKIGLKKK
jgi:hypothetical protein